MMVLYHGSNTPIHEIDLDKCRPYKDFGKGFYLTVFKEQAIAMSKRVSKIFGGTSYITSFDFDGACLGNQSLSVKIFDAPTTDWAMFVLNNRSRNFADISDSMCNHDNKYDIVIGPIANDDIALLFRSFERGLIDIERLTKEMEYKKLSNQYSFHTPKALLYLKRLGDERYG
ncbi:MAG: DUF3990 domain-containing protein [Oscillospiraceae bacterium]|nr:DUF3990 domain-containing protein [Oscillospiraceae bacterium]